MSPVLVFGPVRGIGEGFAAPGELTHVGLLARVRPQVGLQVLKPGVGLGAGLELESVGERTMNKSLSRGRRHHYPP